MQAKELREQGGAELRVKELELREELFRLRLRKGAGQLGNPMKIREVRRDLARLRTVLREVEGRSA